MSRALLPAVAVVSALTFVVGGYGVAESRSAVPEPVAARSPVVVAPEGAGAGPEAGRTTGAGAVAAHSSVVGAGSVVADDDPPTVPVAPAARWRWPLAPAPPVLRRFRAPPGPYAAGHRGLDLAAGAGAPILAVVDGRVSHSGVVAGRGTVTVLHAGGLRSSYEPADPVVEEGDAVTAGQVLGVVSPAAGSAHCGTRPCLHLGARQGDGYVDPWPLLVGGRVVLLPMGRGP